MNGKQTKFAKVSKQEDDDEGGGVDTNVVGVVEDDVERAVVVVSRDGIFHSTETQQYTETSPPGADLLTAWAVHDMDDDVKEEVENKIRQFMGPRNHLGQELRQRKQERIKALGGAPFESVCYRQIDTPVWHNYTQSLPEIPKTKYITNIRRFLTCKSCCYDKADPVTRFLSDTRFVTRVLLFVLGIAVSITGFTVELASRKLLEFKIRKSLELGHEKDGFVFFLALSVIFGFVAFLPVAYRPVSAGSGIAEAKAVLNGIILPKCTELRTALCKALSVIFTSASSLPVGLEGPMIFMGLSLGENLQRFIPKTYTTLLSDRYRRDFAAVGTACGVSSAFLSPVGGVLFAMEEGSSFWSVMLAWRSFGAACVTSIFSYIWGWLERNAPGVGAGFDVHALGKFHGMQGERDATEVTFRIYDYAFFALMGIAGGVLGAAWCTVNRAIAIRRDKLIKNLISKCLMVLILVAVHASLVWWIPHAHKKCTPLAIVYAEDINVFRQFGCPDGEYNQLATLLLNPPGAVSINLLFWEGENSFDASTCVIAGALYMIMLLLCFGTSISMGIFIPLLYSGACFGRALGIMIDAGQETRTFAIVGSIALLAGVVRVLVSLTTIMLTCTGLPYMVTPFMVATLFARASGKWISGRPGIYDIILDLKGIPFLEENPPEVLQYQGLRASDIMTCPIVTVEPEMNVGVLLGLLNEYSFLDFPMIDKSRDGRLVGVITRTDMLKVLSCRGTFYEKGDGSGLKSLKHTLLLQEHFCGPKLDHVEQKLEDADVDKFVDLTPYVSIAHYTFDQNGSAPRAYELFRLLGLRTLIVTGALGLPVGIISRHDLKELELMYHDEARLADEQKTVAAYQTMS